MKSSDRRPWLIYGLLAASLAAICYIGAGQLCARTASKLSGKGMQQAQQLTRFPAAGLEETAGMPPPLSLSADTVHDLQRWQLHYQQKRAAQETAKKYYLQETIPHTSGYLAEERRQLLQLSQELRHMVREIESFLTETSLQACICLEFLLKSAGTFIYVMEFCMIAGVLALVVRPETIAEATGTIFASLALLWLLLWTYPHSLRMSAPRRKQGLPGRGDAAPRKRPSAAGHAGNYSPLPTLGVS